VNAEAIASLTTAAGTLILAIATFGATRSANRSSKIAERSLLIGIRPLLVSSDINDAEQKIGFSDQHWVHVSGGGAAVEVADGNVYLVISLRNVGPGIGVLQSWSAIPGRPLGVDQVHAPVEEFRRLTRDIYIPAGGLGMWQGALRDADEELHTQIAAAARDRTPVTIDILYTDMHGGQRTVSRLALTPVGDDRWMSAAGRHWMLDGASPR
jgi:hypothetical protein